MTSSQLTWTGRLWSITLGLFCAILMLLLKILLAMIKLKRNWLTVIGRMLRQQTRHTVNTSLVTSLGTKRWQDFRESSMVHSIMGLKKIRIIQAAGLTPHRPRP